MQDENPVAPEVETEIVKSQFHVPLIHGCVVKAMQRLRKIAKTKTTTGGEKFSYRGIEEAMSALQPVLIELGLYVKTDVVSAIYDQKESKSGNVQTVCFMQVRYTLTCIEDGSFIESVVASEGMDVSDKASNKALSNCLKYWVFQSFMIPTTELKDSESDLPPKDDGLKPRGARPPANSTPPHPGEGKAPPAAPPKPPAPAPYLFKVADEQLVVSGTYAKGINEAKSLQALQQAFAEGMLKAKELGVPDEQMFPWDFQWNLEEAKIGVLVLRARMEKTYHMKKQQEGSAS